MQELIHSGGHSISSINPSEEPSNPTVWQKVPEFHHAAAHKMFHYWSKLNVKLPEDVVPLRYLKQVDDADKPAFEVEILLAAEIPLSTVTAGIQSMFQHIERLPFVLRHLLTFGGLSREVCQDIFRGYQPTSPSLDPALVFRNQTAEELLLQTVVLKHLSAAMADSRLSAKADLSFQHALQQLWKIQTQQTPQALPFRFLLVVILLYLYGRPFAALSMLQNMESLVHNTVPNINDNL
jgi:hypothetical protein